MNFNSAVQALQSRGLWYGIFGRRHSIRSINFNTSLGWYSFNQVLPGWILHTGAYLHLSVHSVSITSNSSGPWWCLMYDLASLYMSLPPRFPHLLPTHTYNTLSGMVNLLIMAIIKTMLIISKVNALMSQFYLNRDLIGFTRSKGLYYGAAVRFDTHISTWCRC